MKKCLGMENGKRHELMAQGGFCDMLGGSTARGIGSICI